MSELRQRKKESKVEEKNEGKAAKPAEGKGTEQTEIGTWIAWGILLVPMIILPAGACAYAYQNYGVNFFIPESWQYLSHTPEYWQKEILAKKTVVMVGGPHRGGTTLLWECLREHPDIANFGSQHQTASDLSEGIFLQDVYPNFGIGHEIAQSDWRRRRGGMGQFALGKEEWVHLLEDHRLVTEYNQARLLNRYGYFWNMSKPVLLEKSPPNAVISRFLQALMNLNVPGGYQDGEGHSPVKFVFITRHPIANAMSHKSWQQCKYMPMSVLVANWVAVNKYMVEDIPKLQFAKLVRLEDFQQDPDAHLEELFKWIGLDVSKWSRGKSVIADTNAKYQREYCSWLKAKPNHRVEHEAIKEQFGEQIEKLGYDLASYECT
ncbi:hypothetical protein AAMO2058_001340900 [Amorphochlora amoebiformis]